MVQHYVDPSAYSADQDVTSLFAAHGLSTTVEVIVRDDATNGKYLELYSSTGTGSTFLEHLASNADAGIENAEVLIKQEITVQNTSLIYGLVRANSTRDGYGSSYFGDASSDFRLNQFTDGAFSSLDVGSITFSTGAIVWQRIRIETSGGNTSLWGRIWLDGSVEPGTWDLFSDLTFASPLATGFTGLAFFTDNDRTLYKCFWLGIGTNGDSAPDAPVGGVTLTVAALTQAQSVGNVVLTQAHMLALAELQQAQNIESVALTQAHLLAVDQIAQTQTIDGLVLTQAHLLTIQDALQTQGVDSLDLSGAIALTVNELSQAQALDAVTITQAHILSLSALVQSQSLGAVALTQAHTLVADDLAQTQSAEQITLLAGGALTVDGLSQAQSLGSVALTQAHVITLQSLAQSQSVGSVALSHGYIIAPASMSQAQSVETVTLTQQFVLAVAAALQAQSLDPVSLVGGVILVVSDLLQAQLVGSADISQIFEIDGRRLVVVRGYDRVMVVSN